MVVVGNVARSKKDSPETCDNTDPFKRVQCSAQDISWIWVVQTELPKPEFTVLNCTAMYCSVRAKEEIREKGNFIL